MMMPRETLAGMLNVELERALDRLRQAKREIEEDIDSIGREKARREAERAERRKNKEHGE